jgi:hypothetical protein
VLAEIGAAEVPLLVICNKIDETHTAPGVERDDRGTINAFLSVPAQVWAWTVCGLYWPPNRAVGLCPGQILNTGRFTILNTLKTPTNRS